MHSRRTLFFCTIASLALAGVALLPLGPLHVFELKTLDLRFRLRERWHGGAPPTQVRAVLLDDASLEAFAHWPLPYAPYAATVAAATSAGARVLGVDLLVAPADTSRPHEARDYRRLVDEVARAPGTVLAVGPPLLPWPPETGATLHLAPVVETRAYPWACAGRDATPSVTLHAQELPALELARAVRRIGWVQLPRDEDGVVRRVPLLLGAGDVCYPSFALQLVCEHDGVPPSGVRQLRGAIELWRDGRRVRRIPVDRTGCLLVNYRDRSRDRASDLSLAGVAAGGAALGAMRDRVVLLGTTAHALSHFQSTPLVPQLADVHILGEAVETILAGQFVQPVPRPLQFCIGWAFLFAGALLMVRLPPWRGVLVGIGLMALYLGLEKAVFIWGGIWLDFIGPMFALQVAVVGFPLCSYRRRSLGLVEELGRLRRFDDLILSTMSSGLLVADDSGRIVKANARAAHVLGCEDESLVGRTLHEVFDGSPSAQAAVGRALSPGGDPPCRPACSLPRHVPVVLESNDPEGDRLLDLSVSALDEGEAARHAPAGYRWLLNFTDITERVRLLQEDERRARLAAVGEIAARLGHEIRNSLGGLRLYVENVREEIEPQSPAGHTIDSMVDEIEGLYRKIDELREYARDPILELSDCDLKQVIEEALAYSSQQLRDKHIQVVIEAQPRLAPVRADRRQIRDAFQNLINNAVEAAPVGGRLRIGIERAAGANGGGPPGHFLVHFEDDGPGIPPEIGAQMFSLLFTTKAETGTGLGLPIVKKIVESHGGRIGFQSEPGRGTRFTVSLPPEQRAEAAS